MTPDDFNPDYLVPGTRIGAYVVRTMLGQGGTSSVYEVESAEGHRFALKMCRYHGGAAYGTSEWRVDQRYSRSIICLQLLKGRRNVAELYAHDRYPDPFHGYQYLVQELVPDGLLITDWVRRESPTLRKLVGAFVELAELCSVMASKGICHRDLKPANILVTPDGTPKVIDFESATCPHAEPVTRRAASEVPGTGGWQSPEVCLAILEEQSKKKSKKGFDFLPWGDLFSLGVVFYECLTGEHPFDTSLPEDMLLAEVAFETPIHPVRLSTAVPFGLNKVVMKLLKKQPKARYHDGAEVANDLRKLLEKVKDKRWDKPVKLPVPDEEDAPVLPLVSALVPPQTPTPEPMPEKESEGPMPDTPPSEPDSSSREATSFPQSARPDASPQSADTDVLLSDELDTAEPRGLPESEPAVGTVLDLGKAGAYTLEQRLGRGGMGEVYKARQVGARGFSQLVAIKRLRPGWREWEERSFADEARVLSLLHHENIARVYGFFELAGNPYLVMEYIEGDSLYSLLELASRNGHRFSESVACAVMAEVADALHYAHHVTDEAGRPLHVVHRDVSPTNILIAKRGRVVLVDFGVALSKVEGRTATRTGSNIIKGKAPYLSPEQVKHLPVDARSDLFSVGTILVEMLTGEAPFGWTADFITLKRIAAVTPEYVASLLPDVSEPLRALCQKLLAPNPDQRFATGREVAMALRRHAGLGEGQQSVQAEVERLRALPNAKTPPVAAVAAARALSKVKRARRSVAVAGALMLATLAFVSWYVPRQAAIPPLPSSPLQRPPAVALQRPPTKSIPPAQPVPPPPISPLMGMPQAVDGATAGAEPADPAPTAHSAAAVALADKKPRIPQTVTAPPAGAPRAVSQAQASAQADKQVKAVTDPPTPEAVNQALEQTTKELESLKVENRLEEEQGASVDHALAALLARNQVAMTPFTKVKTWLFHEDSTEVKVHVFASWMPAARGKVGVVFDVTNQDGAKPWKLQEVRLTTLVGGMSKPFALRTTRPSIGPGEKGRVAIVTDINTLHLKEGDDTLVVELYRDGGLQQAALQFVASSLR